MLICLSYFKSRTTSTCYYYLGIIYSFVVYCFVRSLLCHGICCAIGKRHPEMTFTDACTRTTKLVAQMESNWTTSERERKKGNFPAWIRYTECYCRFWIVLTKELFFFRVNFPALNKFTIYFVYGYASEN